VSGAGVPLHRRPRLLLLLAIATAGLVSVWHLGLAPWELWGDGERVALLGRFFAAALSPTLTSESGLATAMLPRIARATTNTVVFATAATSLALVAGSLLGLLASRRFWTLFAATRAAAPLLHGSVRAFAGLLRSIHEVLWALMILAAFGLSPAAAVLAIAIPYSGTFAKIFSEMLDETGPEAGEALRLAGAPTLGVFAFGLLPGALPDMGAYAFYRFECALRSAAILGFFGFATLGKLIFEAAGELHFHETWTGLYALFALILAVEWWSGALRQRLTVA